MSTYSDDWSGKTLGPYEILNEVGRGGMATVYRARQPSINRIVAVKVLPRSFMHDPGFIERFLREVDVVTRLEHPHILPIYDYGEIEDVRYIAMRFMAGGSIGQRLERGRPALSWLVKPLMQVSLALDYAHQHGVIHRDLKPGNILLDEAENAYLSDFGIARVANSRLTGSTIIGTPSYMSPEQAQGQLLSPRSDVYSLGVVLFELVTGREPFEGVSPLVLMFKHITEPLPSVREFRPDAPPEIDAIIARATAKAPNERYATTAELATAYQAAAQSSSTDDTEPVTLHSAATPRVPTWPAEIKSEQPTLEGNDPKPTPISSPKLRWLRLALVAAIIVGFVAFAMIWARMSVPIPDLIAPTPFPGAQVATTGHVRVDVPSDWTTYDFSTDTRQLNVWKPTDGSASVSIAYDAVQAGDFASAIKVYEANFGNTTGRELIDEATAPDGSLRRSYRVVSGPTAPGQVDQFYLNRAPFLIVVETYSADSTGNRDVSAFQNVLDSLQVITAAS